MVRSQILAFALISACGMQMTQAGQIKDASIVAMRDTGRVVGYTAAGAAIYAATNTLLHSIAMLVIRGEFCLKDLTPTPAFYLGTRVCAAMGATAGLGSTTYGRTLRAQWNLWWWTSKDLVAIAMDEYENDAALVSAIEQYYLNNTFPLISAKISLANKLSDLQHAAELVQDALEDLEEESLRAQELDAWLDEIYTMRAYVVHAANAIEKDPRLPAVLEAFNKRNIADAQTNIADAQMVGAIAKVIGAINR